MISGIYFTTSGMNVEQKRMEILSNNLANVNSIGYKKRNVTFVNYQDMVISALHKQISLGSLSKGLVMDDVSIDLTGGYLKFTQNPLDLAINDYNFFVIEDLYNNNLLTKNGAFKLDSENYLVNNEGYKVLGTKGYIKIPSTDANNLLIDSNGNIFIENQFIDKLKIISVNSPNDLIVTDSPYFILKEDRELIENKNVNIMQGFLESSNVNGINEMVDMIAVMRSYEMNQKIIKMQDETLSKAVNNIGKI